MADPNTIRKIADALRAPAGAHVVEIGAGMGALTEVLHERYERFTALEIDERAVEYLARELPEVDVRHEDVLEVDWATLAREKDGPLYVIGNVPYNISSQILFSLVEAPGAVEEVVMTLQREVAERIVAEPRTKAYGILSVVLQLYGRPEMLFTVSRNVFYPKPNVESAVLRVTLDGPYRPAEGPSPKHLRAVVRAGFGQRRKTLRNSLHRWTREQGIALPHDWERKRAEALTPEEFLELARHLEAHQAAREEEG